MNKESEAFSIVACALAGELSNLDDGSLSMRLSLESEMVLGRVGFRITARWFEKNESHTAVGSRMTLEQLLAFRFSPDIIHLIRDVARFVEKKRADLNSRNELNKAHSP